ncbi:MAG: hypothetical protein RL071_161 [Pseudomonadota bacterium]|jgi:DNA gyrase subunit B
MPVDPEVLAHFTARAAHYDRSSAWCTDDELGARTVALADAAPDHVLLDVACGTGLVARRFKGQVAQVIGVDLTPAMYAQAAPHLDQFLAGPGEALPLPDQSVDRVTCRQGVQFMDDAAAAAEMFRVLRPGGKVLLIHLCAYGEEDKAEYFEVLRLRNPARRNFYLRGDLASLLRGAGFVDVAVHDAIVDEDVDVWSDNKAIDEGRREAIRAVYRSASPAFAALHGVRIEGGQIVDRMLFGLAVGTKPA